jgi:hypothetical protein
MKRKTTNKATPSLDKLCGIKDCATGNWSYEFGFPSADGTRGRVIVPGDHANKATNLIDHLNRKGATLPVTGEERDELIKGAIAAEPSKLIYQVANAGWQIQKDGSVFYTVGNRIIGAPSGRIEYMPPQMIADSAAAEFAERGTLDDWKSRIAEKALFSTSLTIGISAGFAAPLMRASGLGNFAIHLFATTRGGKSTTMLCGMSVSGIGDERKLKSWNSSGSVELLEAATTFNDALFSLNEVGAAKGKKKEAYPILREFYAQYAEGRDRSRHSVWEKAHGGRAKRFWGICMVSAEHSVAWYAEQAGDARDGGELFRAIDVPAVREGKETVLDLAPDDLNQDDCLDKLRDDLRSMHGAPLKPYIEFLIALGPQKLNTRLRTLIRRFVEAMPAAAHDKVARQIAKHVGVLYAGAILGIEAGVLPWSAEHALRTHQTAFDDAFAETKIVDPLIRALDILKTNLRDKIVERTPDSTFGAKEHAGYWEIVGGEKIVVVHARQFRSWFGGDAQFRIVLEWLCKQGHLKHSKGTNGILAGGDLDGVTLRWPRSVIVRSFSFADPFAEPPTKPPVPPTAEPVAPMIAGSAEFLARRQPRPYAARKRGIKPKLATGAKDVVNPELRKVNKPRRTPQLPQLDID